MKILVVGHSMVVDTNRKFWSDFARENKAEVDLVFPQNWVSNLVRKLTFKKNEVTDREVNLKPLPVYFKGNASAYFYSIMSFWRILNSKQYDAIIVTQETWSFSALQVGISKLFTSNQRTKSYLSLCQNIKKRKLTFLWPLEWFITSFFTKMLYCDSAICDVLKWKHIHHPTFYFPFTYDQDVFTPLPFEKSSKLRVGYLGRLAEEKGLKDLVRAIQKLDFPAELVIAGNGDLKEWIQAQPGVNFLGVLPHSEAHHFYQKIDVLVLPSRTTAFWKEQFGRVMVEAVARGKPVIGSSSGAIPEVLGKIGLRSVFQEGDSDDLAQKLAQMHQDISLPGWNETMKNLMQTNRELFSHIAVSKQLAHELTHS